MYPRLSDRVCSCRVCLRLVITSPSSQLAVLKASSCFYQFSSLIFDKSLLIAYSVFYSIYLCLGFAFALKKDFTLLYVAFCWFLRTFSLAYLLYDRTELS